MLIGILGPNILAMPAKSQSKIPLCKKIFTANTMATVNGKMLMALFIPSLAPFMKEVYISTFLNRPYKMIPITKNGIRIKESVFISFAPLSAYP